jgi:transposase-like protein
MTAPHIVDTATVLGEAPTDARHDLMRYLLQTIINDLLSADVDAVVCAERDKPSPERVSHRNGYRRGDLDTRVGAIDSAAPKLRLGTDFREWLLKHRRRSEAASVKVIADCYLAGGSTRRMNKLVKSLNIHAQPRSQVSRMAGELDEQATQLPLPHASAPAVATYPPT